MKKILALIFISISVNTFSQDILSADAKLINDAGILIYPNSTYINGGKDVGYRYVSNEKPEVIQEWYRQQLSTWALYAEYGGWIIYDGEAGLGIGDLMMTLNQVSVQHNENLPEWFSLDKDVTTEILIGVYKY